MIRPEIEQEVIVVAVEVHVAPLGVAVAVYVMPSPSPTPCTHDTSSALLFVAATRPVTALGGPVGIPETAAEATPTPTPLVAVTANEYVVLFTNPVMVHVVPDETEHEFPPGVAVAV